jgi:DNA polymerase III subunit beta
MEILVRRNDLVKELQLVQGIVERKNSIPILSNVLAEARSGELRIAATDLDVSLRCGCAAQVVEEGAVTLGAKKLYEIVRSLPDSDVSVKVEGDAWARIKCERVEFKMAGLPREDFPTIPEARAAKAVDIPAGVLRSLIQRTSFAITAEDARYYLAGALLVLDPGAAAMVATDGHRLAWAQKSATLKVAEPTKVLVPRKAITELARLIEDMGGEEAVSFHQGEGHLIFTAGGRTLASKMVEAQFPAYEKVVAVTGDKKVNVGREVLNSAIRRVSLLSSERGRAVRLSLEDGRLEVSASSPELGEARESLPLEYAGESVEIGFNAQYLLEFLGVVGTAEVALEVKDAESQGILRPVGEDGGDYRYVVMPMRF